MRALRMNINNKRGNALVLVLPLVVVVAATVEVVFNQTISFSNTIKSYKVVTTRNSIVNNMTNYASMPSTYRSSVHPSLGTGVNPELQNCLFGNGPNPCQANQPTPVTLYAAVSSSSATPSTPLQIIAGPAGAGLTVGPQPALYDVQGNLCDPNATLTPTAQCPFQVAASFKASCPNNTPTCAVASGITVSFIVTTPSSPSVLPKMLTLAPVTQSGTQVSVNNILPPSITSSQLNVAVLGQINVIGSAPTVGASVTTGPSMAAIEAAVAAGGVTDQNDIVAIAQDFVNAGLWSNLGYITAVVQAGYKSLGSYLPDMIIDLAIDNITDTQTAVFLTQVGVTDAKWMKFVLASGVTDLAYDNMEFGYSKYLSSPQAYASAVNAALAAGIPDGSPVSQAIVATGSTSATLDQQLYQAVANVPDPYIAAGMIMGNQTTPGQISAILAAVTGMDDLYGGAIAQMGITNPALAQQLASIVSAIPNPYDAANILLAAQGNIATTEALVASYSAAGHQTGGTGTLPSTTTTTPSSGGTDGSTGQGPSATPSVPVASQSGGATSLVSTCASCSILTF